MEQVTKPENALVGHTSPETAYIVADYPYGRKVRCRIRYWLEYREKHGFRLMSQTENPKTGAWNAPKGSTYRFLAGAMYLDDKGHVQFAGLTEYAEARQVRAFLARFPHIERTRIHAWVLHKYVRAKAFHEGTAYFTINGEKHERSAEDCARDEATMLEWLALKELLSQNGPSAVDNPLG